MLTEYRCQYDDVGKMAGVYPWDALTSPGDMVRVEECRKIKSLRISAVQWGRRTGGKLQVEDIGDGAAIVTMRLAPVHVLRDTRYDDLDTLKPGQTCVIPWLMSRDGLRQGRQQALTQAILRRFPAGTFYTTPKHHGLEVFLRQ